MRGGFEKTIRALTRSNNRAAADLLQRAMNSSHEGVRRTACLEVISSKGSPLILEFIRHIDTLDETVREILEENPAKLATPIRIALLGKERLMQKNAIRAALTFRVYDLIPILLNILVPDRSESRPQTDVPLEELLIRLTRQFVADIQQQNITASLQNYIISETTMILHRIVRNYRRSDDPVALKVFLLIGRYIHDRELKSDPAFRNPMHPIYAALAGILQTEKETYVFEFILESLHAREVPGLVLAAISNRIDIHFLLYLFEELGPDFSPEVLDNLARIHRLEWITQIRPLTSRLTDRGQETLVALLRSTRLPNEEIYLACRQIYQYGKSHGRSAALFEMATSPLEEVDELLLEASEDVEPEVRATALRLLRARNHPQATMKLLKNIDSPDQGVREVVQGLLPEFRIHRFLEMYDLLNDEQRAVTFKIVRKVDPHTNEVLSQEIQTGSTVKKARALKCIELGKLAPQMEEPLCSLLLHGESAPLRIKAAELLSQGRREISRLTLMQAFHNDESYDVRVVAKSSLEIRETQRKSAKSPQ